MCGQGDHPPYDTTFMPQQHNAGRCQHCGTLRRDHRGAATPGLAYSEPDPSLICPAHYRPGDLTAAYRDLQRAVDAGDPSRIFVARGEVQRLGGDPDQINRSG